MMAGTVRRILVGHAYPACLVRVAPTRLTTRSLAATLCRLEDGSSRRERAREYLSDQRTRLGEKMGEKKDDAREALQVKEIARSLLPPALLDLGLVLSRGSG